MAVNDRTASSRQLAVLWSTATRVLMPASSIHRRLLHRGVRGNLNSNRYVREVLQLEVVPFLQGILGVFQQYNARPHVAKTVRDFCSAQLMQLLPWPAYSWDMSPIEHVWDLVPRRLARDPGLAASKDELLLYIQAIWNSLPQADIQNLFDSMSNRIATLNTKHGATTKKIGSRVGRNQTTVMWICDRWMQEGTMDRHGRWHPPQCTTSREYRQIVRMAVTDHSVTSRTVAQHIESVTHHSLSIRTIPHRFQQSGFSARRPFLGLPLMQNHRRPRRQWCDEGRMWAAEWKEVVFTDESRICLTHHDGRIRVWRHCGEMMLNSCVMHRHTGPASGIMLWGGIGYHSCTPLVRITGTLSAFNNFALYLLFNKWIL
ncbi:transposable element Tcb1 transposase [Trichonephila clavipes]|nr:transposable element Tcb1 transposase [Trichonephila clavipes]